MPGARPDFYGVQRSQWIKTLGLFAVLLLIYVFAVGIVALALLFSVGFLAAGGVVLSGAFLSRFIPAVIGLSALIAVVHFYDARRSGAAYILKRLQAAPAERADRYHARFADAVEEIAIACGRPGVRPYVLPSSAFNSLAIIEADGTPAVGATEGLLAEASRDEMLAVVAHELAHIVRGDALYVTMVCSLANLFERVREALEPEADTPSDGTQGSGRGGGPRLLLYPVVVLSSIVMRLLSALLSREREILADAAAVEFGRDPAALARALFKAQIKNSFVGDFSASYSPLFMVPPRLDGESEGFWDRLFSTHPPLMTRVRRLAAMAHLSGADIIHQVHVDAHERAEARAELAATEPPPASPEAGSGAKAGPARVWYIRSPRGAWEGPFSLEDLLLLPNFTPQAKVKDGADGVEARAREFAAVRAALAGQRRRRPVREEATNACPRCRVPLGDSFYEGVAIKACPACRGKLVDQETMDRILARREVGFGPDLVAKARAFQERLDEDPVEVMRVSEEQRPGCLCPACGYRMRPRPYNYQYYIPVDKCLSCRRIWFDADELEILQILVERKGRFQRPV